MTMQDRFEFRGRTSLGIWIYGYEIESQNFNPVNLSSAILSEDWEIVDDNK